MQTVEMIHGIEVTMEPIDFQEEAQRLFSLLDSAAQASVLTIMDAIIADSTEDVISEIKAIYERLPNSKRKQAFKKINSLVALKGVEV